MNVSAFGQIRLGNWPVKYYKSPKEDKKGNALFGYVVERILSLCWECAREV